MQKKRLKIIFIGYESRLLSYLAESQHKLNIELCAVYVFKARFSIKHFRKWLAQFQQYRQFIYFLKSLYPTLAKKHWRHFALYQIEQTARKYNIPCIKQHSINSQAMRDELNQYDIDLGVVASFAEKIDIKTLAATKYGFINFHPGRLPKYRGKDPIKKAITNGDKEITICWHEMNDKIDDGEILVTEKLFISKQSKDDIIQQAVVCACDCIGQAITILEQRKRKNV